MSWDTGPNSQPRGTVEKQNLAAEVMGGKTKGNHPRAPKFHRMSITAAENGVSVEHTVKKFKNDTKHKGGNDTPVNPSSTGPWGEGTDTKTHVLGNDHPMMAHLNALHEHFTSGNTDDSLGED